MAPTLPVASSTVTYAPVAVITTTRIIKTMTMLSIIGYVLTAVVYFITFASLGAGATTAEERSGLTFLSLFSLVLAGGCAWLFIVAYQSILKLRTECLEAKMALYAIKNNSA